MKLRRAFFGGTIAAVLAACALGTSKGDGFEDGANGTPAGSDAGAGLARDGSGDTGTAADASPSGSDAAEGGVDAGADGSLADASLDASADAPLDALPDGPVGPTSDGWTFQGVTASMSRTSCVVVGTNWDIVGTATSADTLIFYFPARPTASATYTIVGTTSLGPSDSWIALKVGGTQWDSVAGGTVQVEIVGGKVRSTTVTATLKVLGGSATAPLVGRLTCP